MRTGRDEDECRGDLIARERRGGLSASDQLALGAHLETCSSCRLTRDIRADFEAQSAVDVGDAARIARLSAAARRWSQRRSRPPARGHWLRRRLRGLPLSLVLLLVAGTASATIWWWRAPIQPTFVPAPPSRVGRPVAPPRARVALRERAARTAPPAETPPAVVEAPAAAPAPAQAPAAEARATARRRDPITAVRERVEPASSLLRRAGEARHQGEIDLAVVLYRRLQRDFRDTPEATLSSVLLGGILLQRGLFAPALQQFDRYLAAQPRGTLMPEALYGRGRALAALGHGADEIQAWRRLLDQFPDSAYAPHARRRLDELK